MRRLETAVATSGLSMRQLAHALGTSPSRFSSYSAGKVAPSAAFLLRAERIATALSQARRDRVPTVIDAVESIRRALSTGDEDWAYAVALEARDRVRDILSHQTALAAVWEIQPPAVLDERWRVLLAALVSHEFVEAGRPVPTWTVAQGLEHEWVLDTPRLSTNEIRRQTPSWLAERNIFIAVKDLVTL
jgi:hypothetical protein